MLSFTSPALKTRDNQFRSSRGSSIRSTSNASSCSSSSPPNIPFKPGHLRSTSSQIRVQNRIVRAVDLHQDCLTSPQVASSLGASAHYGDQSTIKASQRRPPRETVSAIRELMEDFQRDISPSIPEIHGKMNIPSQKWPGKPRDCENGPAHPKSLQGIHLDTNKQSYHPLQVRDEVSHTTHQFSTFTPLTNPQRAIALYCFDPEVFDPSESEGEGDSDSESLTPEIRFQSQDILEIWVPDIGGGWSLGKNLSNSYFDVTLSRLELNQIEGDHCSELGLIPIGWYKVCLFFFLFHLFLRSPGLTVKFLHLFLVEFVKVIPSLDTSCSLSKQSASPASVATPTNRVHKSFSNPLGPQDSIESLIDFSNTEFDNAKQSFLDDSAVSKGPKKSSKSRGLNSSSRPSSFLFPTILIPSVSVNKQFDTNEVRLNLIPRGIASSVTASDAMLAARQAHDRQKSDQFELSANSSRKQRNSSWNLFLSIGARSSTAHLYITGKADSEKDTKREQDCTERYEIEAGPIWKEPVSIFTVAVHHPKLQIHQSNTRAHMVYTVVSTFFVGDGAQDGSLNRLNVNRRYSHFERLFMGLDSIYGEVFDLPSLPEKGYTAHYDEDSLSNRRRGLERYLVRLIRHPVLRYSPMLTTFLGCEDVEDFEQEARTWGQSHPSISGRVISPYADSATSSFFSKVFHPDYNVDESEICDSIEAYNKYTKSMESQNGMVDLEKNLTNLRNSIQSVSRSFEKTSSSIQRLCAGLSPPHKRLQFNRKKKLSLVEDSGSDFIDYSNCSEEYKPSRKLDAEDVTLNEEDLLRGLRRDARDLGLQNSDGALCWRDGCTECLGMTKALQLLGESLGNVAETYSACAIETLAPVQDLIKELSFPHKSRKVLSNLHNSTKVSYSDLNEHCSVDGFESRKETVMNVVMSEIERHHQEKNQDYCDLTKKLLDSQIKLHQTACDQLKEARKALEERQLQILGSSGARDMNSEEKKALIQDEKRMKESKSQQKNETNESRGESSLDLNIQVDASMSCTSSVLEWVTRSANYSKKNMSQNHHHRHPSLISNTSTLLPSSTFSSFFVKPLSAAFASMSDLSDYLP